MLTPTASTASLQNYDCKTGFVSENSNNSADLIVYTLMVKGMTCAACSSCIESTLKSNLDTRELKTVTVDLNTKTVTLHCTESFRIDAAVDLINKSGFTVTGSSSDWRCRLEARKRSEAQEYAEIKKQFVKILFFSFPVILTPHHFKFLALIFSIPLHCYAAFEIYKSALIKCNMERLIALNCFASLLYSTILWEQHGMFDCAAYVLILYTGGKFLETALKRKINVTGDDLLISLPETVRFNGVNVALKDMRVGHVIDLNPGDLIPFDGEIMDIKTALFVNESTFTGEPLPKQKHIDDHVFTGSRVESGCATMKITKSIENSFINKIARGVYEPMLEDDHESSLVDEIARWFIPIIMTLSIFTFVVWYSVFWFSSAMPRDLIPEWRNTLKYPSTPLAASIYFSLTVLCIACPCALAVASPIAVAISKSASLRKGVLIRDPRAFLLAPTMDILLFDKTGTLTTGKPKISFKQFEGFEPWMFEACRVLESRVLEEMEHPIARSIYNYCKTRVSEKSIISVEDVSIIPGKGVVGAINGNGTVNIAIIKKEDCSTSSSQLFINDSLKAEFSWFDELKTESLDIINHFKFSNYRLGLISGDSQSATERTASQFLPGTFSYVFGDCKPEDKARIVSDLKSQGNRVTFIGDGLNDSVAMSQADFSISLDPTVTFPSVNLITSISALPQIFTSSRNLNRQINFNLIWASLYNLMAIPLAMGAGVILGIKPIGPEIGTLLMMISGISIILSSLLFL